MTLLRSKMHCPPAVPALHVYLNSNFPFSKTIAATRSSTAFFTMAARVRKKRKILRNETKLPQAVWNLVS